VPAALWRKHRAGELTSEDAALLTSAFEADYDGTPTESPRFASVAVDAAILDLAARLTAVHPLRAYDAVQLASALTVRSVDPTCDAFACFDRALRAAAAQCGFALLP
jgi:predicted nucleic acid-binding protein